MKIFSFPTAELAGLNRNYQLNINVMLTGVSTAVAPKSGTLLFAKKVNASFIEKIKKCEECVLIIPCDCSVDLGENTQRNVVIYAENPRLEYAKILQFILQSNSMSHEECFASAIGTHFKKGRSCKIGHNVIIGNDVEIGDHCTIMAGAVLNDRVKIGNNTVIRENAVIGGYGFGFERDEQGIPVRLPHVGGVVIGDHVEIGAFATVAAGTIEPTTIGNYTKIDDHVLIAHNCQIGEKCLIIGGSDLGGSVRIGNRVWVGPNSAIINGIEIADDCMVGIGSVVKKTIGAGMVVSGNPAKSLISIKDEREVMRMLKKMLKEK